MGHRRIAAAGGQQAKRPRGEKGAKLPHLVHEVGDLGARKAGREGGQALRVKLDRLVDLHLRGRTYRGHDREGGEEVEEEEEK